MARPFKVHHLLVCDDIRYELGGKLTLVGTYGPNVNVARLPARLKLSFRIEVSMLKLGRADIHVTVHSPRGAEVARIELVGEVEELTNREVLPLTPVLFEAPEEGEYKVAVRCFDTKVTAGSFNVRLVESVVSGPPNLRQERTPARS